MSADLRSFFHSVGRFRAQRSLDATPVERADATSDVTILDEHAARIEADPLAVHSFVDGIQASLLVTHRDRRPVYLFWVAAGAVGAGAKPVAADEALTVVASEADRAWVEGLEGDLDSVFLESIDPPSVEGAAHRLLGRMRADAEKRLVDVLVADLADGQHIVLDGSLSGRTWHERLVGVVKTARTRYLPDEAELWRLREGWRSPTFTIQGRGDNMVDRHSCYLRLHEDPNGRWDHGLIRVEAHRADLLEPLCARALAERQSAGAHDARWDRHLAGVRACEEFLRARRSPVFGT